MPDPEDVSVDEIFEAFGGKSGKVDRTISLEVVEGWMRSSDIHVRGCLYTMLVDSVRFKHVSPPLEAERVSEFVVDYLIDCVARDPESEWADSRYLAGHALAAWMKQFLSGDIQSAEALRRTKKRLEALYREGDDGARDAIVNAVLEHAFEDRSLKKYFDDWARDPALGEAYRLAQDWSRPR